VVAPPLVPLFKAIRGENVDAKDIAFAAIPVAGKIAPEFDAIKLVSAKTLHWSQEGITAFTKGKPVEYLDDLAQDMAQGWKGDPLQVLEVDGKLVSLDNRRLTVAKMLGIDVPVIITKGTMDDLIKYGGGRDGIFTQIPIRGTDMIIDMFGRMVGQ
jgi:hypothetical protein